MFPIVVGLSMVKSIGPFLRQHVLESISIAEFIFVNSILIAMVSFMYVYVHRKEPFTNLITMSNTQYGAIFVTSIVTILSAFAIVRLEEDGILSSIFLVRTVSSIFAILIGIFLFEEQLTLYQIVGIIFAVVSASLLMISN
jgi:uncharacterized membrane protein